MSKTINLTLAAAFAVSAVWSVPAMAGHDNGAPCSVGQTDCVADDGDDPAKGHFVIPTGQTTTTTTDGDTGAVTTTTSPTPTPAPAPPPSAD